MENTLHDTFPLWAKYLLYHPFIDEDGPCCRRCSIRQRLANCWEGCEMCLDGWMLPQLNRHHRTLLQEYVRSVTAPCVTGSFASCWNDMDRLRWRADWWRSRWLGREWLLTRWEASRWDEEVDDERSQPAMSYIGDPWPLHTLARTTRRSAQCLRYHP